MKIFILLSSLFLSAFLSSASDVPLKINYSDRLLLDLARVRINDSNAIDHTELLLTSMNKKFDYESFDYCISERVILINEHSCIIYLNGSRKEKSNNLTYFHAYGELIHKSKSSVEIDDKNFKWIFKEVTKEEYIKIQDKFNDVLKTPLSFPDKSEGSMPDAPICIIRNYPHGLWAIRDTTINSRAAYHSFGELLTEMTSSLTN